MHIDPRPTEQTLHADTSRQGWRTIQQSARATNRIGGRIMIWLLKSLLVIYFIFCALFLTLRYAVLPQISDYRVKVEQVATKALGRTVSIETITASWRGLRPHLLLGNVVVYDKDGGSALQLPAVSATVAWWSLMVADLRLHRLEIEKPDMDIQRDASGNYYVAGLLIDMKKNGDGKAADWILSQREIRIKDGQLRWQDNLRQAPELLLGNVDMVLLNQGRQHQFALRATPPAAIAAPLDIRANFNHPIFSQRISDASRWAGQLYTDLRDSDLAAWKTYIDFPFDLQQAQGSMRAWLTFDHARVADFTADVGLSNVQAQLRKDIAPLALAYANGRVSIRETLMSGSNDGVPTFGLQGHTISVVDFSLQTDDGLLLPKTTMSEHYVAAKNGAPERIEVQAKSLDLHAWSVFATRLPLPASQLRLLQDFSPRGQLKDFSAQWQGTYPNISSYKVKGNFVKLALNPQPARPARAATAATPAQAAVPAIPGFENLSGRIDASNQGGTFALASDQVKLSLPGFFINEPEVELDALKMNAKWTFQKNDQLLLEVQKMSFARQGLSGSFAGTHLMALQKQVGRPTGTLDVTGSLTGLELKKVREYLPAAMGEEFRSWLGAALVDGILRDGYVKVKGDVAHFPFRTSKIGEKPKGEFIFGGKLDNGSLNYAPDMFGKDGKVPLWPLLEKVKGTILFDRTRMEIIGESGKTHGAELSNVKAVVADLLSAEPVLEIDGNAAGNLQDMVQYTVDSPVSDWIGNFTNETKATGKATLALSLKLPLHQLLDAKVKGELKLANNNVVLQNGIPVLTQANGQLNFNEKGLTLNGVKANFLGGPLTVTGGTQKDGNILIKADGTMSAAGLRTNYPAPAMQKLIEKITGSTRFSTSISVKSKRVEILVDSNLRGLGLSFPAPLSKSAKDALPLRIEQASLPSDNVAIMRDSIKLSLGSSMVASYLREKNAIDTASAWSLVRGGIGVTAPAPEPDGGLMVNVSLHSLNVDEWIDVASTISAASVKGAQSGQMTQNKIADPSDALSMSQYVEPNVIAARADELFLMGKKFDDVVLGVSHDANVWQANIDSAQASGYVNWVESSSGRGLGKVTARLANLVVPKSVGSDVKGLMDGVDSATEMPAMDVVAENFELLGKKLGRLEMIAHYVRATEGREWRIRNLSLTNPDATLTAKGSWLAKNGSNVSNLDYRLSIENAGNLLNRFGFADVLKGGKGKMDGEITWQGLPFSFDVPSLSGDIKLDIAAGQFSKVEPGAAKLLGVLSLQSLPRRLTLDFRDVFSEGFAFDGINGSARIINGVASTDNLKMRGVSATVLLDGTADIGKESQNLRAVVIPEINAGAASVAYALAINPVIGAGTFLAQLFLREPLMRAFTFEYAITGAWSDPNVVKIDRKAQKSSGPSSSRSADEKNTEG